MAIAPVARSAGGYLEALSSFSPLCVPTFLFLFWISFDLQGTFKTRIDRHRRFVLGIEQKSYQPMVFERMRRLGVSALPWQGQTWFSLFGPSPPALSSVSQSLSHLMGGSRSGSVQCRWLSDLHLAGYREFDGTEACPY